MVCLNHTVQTAGEETVYALCYNLLKLPVLLTKTTHVKSQMIKKTIKHPFPMLLT